MTWKNLTTLLTWETYTQERKLILGTLMKGILRGRSVVICTSNDKLVKELEYDEVLLLRYAHA